MDVDDNLDSRPSSTEYDLLTVEGLKAEIDRDVTTSGAESIYDKNAIIINKAIQDIGMGRYQWQLFCLCGFGWLADNLWLQGVALTLPQLTSEFGVDSNTVRYTTLALFVGLFAGASFWGIASDLIGRRLAFNSTLLLAGTFGLGASGAPNWIAVCVLFSCMGFGVGGNLPVDGALFLEFLPQASGNLLTLLSVWWPVGQLTASLIAWILIPRYSCDEHLRACSITDGTQPCCSSVENRGWRYFVLALGSLTLLMFFCRFFLFKLYESPKFLLSHGRQAEAVAVVQGIADHNQTKTWLTEAILKELGGDMQRAPSQRSTNLEALGRSLAHFPSERVRPLFSSRRLSITTSLVWFIWTTTGLGYPLFIGFLPLYFKNVGDDQPPIPTNTVYRNYAITSLVGLPGSVIACLTVDMERVGRKGTMVLSTLISGICLYLFTLSSESLYQLTFSCIEGFFQNVMYGVLYAYTPEIFPGPVRGTGTGIASFLNRVAGTMSPIVAVHAGKIDPAAPILAAGGLFMAAFVAMCLLPIETRGKQTL